MKVIYTDYLQIIDRNYNQRWFFYDVSHPRCQIYTNGRIEDEKLVNGVYATFRAFLLFHQHSLFVHYSLFVYELIASIATAYTDVKLLDVPDCILNKFLTAFLKQNNNRTYADNKFYGNSVEINVICDLRDLSIQ